MVKVELGRALAANFAGGRFEVLPSRNQRTRQYRCRGVEGRTHAVLRGRELGF